MTPPDTGPAILREAEQLPRKTGMDRIRIRGGKRLSGTLPISGAKNDLRLVPDQMSRASCLFASSAVVIAMKCLRPSVG